MKPLLKKEKVPRIVLPLALDSGAHSLYNKFLAARDSSGKRLSGAGMIDKVNLDYIKGKDFKKYLDDYMTSLSSIKGSLEFAVTLDIIYNPEASWDLYREMRKAGHNVLPVYHYGEDVKWLKKYMAETDYIGIGGLGQYNTKQNWLPFGIQTWKTITSDKGKPLVKTHGFAMSSFDLMRRWPWYSIDSTSACTFSRMGAIMLPIHQRGKLDYATTPIIVPLAKGRATDKKFLGHRQPGGIIHNLVLKYLEHRGQTLDQAMGSYIVRDALNLCFMNESMREISKIHSEKLGEEWNTYYYSSGNPTDSIYTFDQVLHKLQKMDALEHLRYLGTFFPNNRRAIEHFLSEWHGVKL